MGSPLYFTFIWCGSYSGGNKTPLCWRFFHLASSSVSESEWLDFVSVSIGFSHHLLIPTMSFKEVAVNSLLSSESEEIVYLASKITVDIAAAY